MATTEGEGRTEGREIKHLHILAVTGTRERFGCFFKGVLEQ
jgi:hypothetical protein